jgi:hypothetical protein
MRFQLLLLLSFILHTAYAQTERIAALSHNGNVQAQTPKNIPGGPPINLHPQLHLRVDSIVFINDSMVIQYTNLGNYEVKNHIIANDPKISTDSLQKIYPHTKLIGFEKKKLEAGMFSIKYNSNDNSLALLWWLGIVTALAGGLSWWQTKRRAA